MPAYDLEKKMPALSVVILIEIAPTVIYSVFTMDTIPKTYNAKDYEDQIYERWNASGAFQPNLKNKKKPFTITMPPPNATGNLHLGHAVMLALEDIMIRFHRMQGRPALWVPGTDHAAIATQNRVEKEIWKEQKKTRHDFSRETFLQIVRDFVEKSKNTIRSQVKKMGSSCDWSREAYTMDEKLNETVYSVFEKMFKDGLIYRGDRIVNWCTRCRSTLADDEVNYTTVTGKFYHFKYGPFEIGTARPETKYGDHIVVVHPDDERYKAYHGKKISIPWIGEEEIIATVVADGITDKDFGTGVLTATPAHSFEDFDLAKRHGFEVVQMINEEGRMTDANGPYAGILAEEAREKFVEILQQKGLLLRIDDQYQHSLSVCYRCSTAIQPLISKQWFIDVNHPIDHWDYKALKLEKGRSYSLKEVALHVVRSRMIEIIPDRFHATYFQWMENLRDWCVSRQIWWGHRIPVWYPKGADPKTISSDQVIVSAKTPGLEYVQDDDTLDTWFSSGLFTFSTLGWLQGSPDFKHFHPTQVLETGYDILFFWVARMILLTTYTTGQIPFEKVYLHGLVRTREGKKMSKSDPATCIDPLDMISEFGADALRLSLFVGSSPGNDVRLYKEKIEGYRNFVNKLWNVGRYILMSTQESEKEVPKTLADEWILSRLESMVDSTTKHLESFRFSSAAEELYQFTWNELADWFLEISKVEKGKDAILRIILKKLLVLWHPFTPFVTEQLWALSGQNGLLITTSWPKHEKPLLKKKAEEDFGKLQSVITAIRNLRSEYQLEPAKKIQVVFGASAKDQKFLKGNQSIIEFLGRTVGIEYLSEGEKPDDAIAQLVSGIMVSLPLKGLVDKEKERLRIQKELEQLKGYVQGLKAKLETPKFLEKAPDAIVKAEKVKLQTALDTLSRLEQQLLQLS